MTDYCWYFNSNYHIFVDNLKFCPIYFILFRKASLDVRIFTVVTSTFLRSAGSDAVLKIVVKTYFPSCSLGVTDVRPCLLRRDCFFCQCIFFPFHPVDSLVLQRVMKLCRFHKRVFYRMMFFSLEILPQSSASLCRVSLSAQPALCSLQYDPEQIRW